MSSRTKGLIAPAYLLLCILLGGSAQSMRGNLALQVIAVAIMVWAAFRHRWSAGATKIPVILLMLGLLLVVLQLVPLPPSLWTAMPGRGGIAGGYGLLGSRLPWLPLSEAPYDSAADVSAILPALGMFTAVRVGHGDRAAAGTLLAGTVAAILVGTLQLAGGPDSPWRFYPITNTGAVGFFANSNHMATLLLASIPFAAALFVSRQSRRRGHGRTAGMAGITAAGLALLLIGVLLNRSMAALLLVWPVLLASAMLVPVGWRLRRFAAPLAAAGVVAAIVVLSFNPIESELPSAQSAEASVQSRQVIWRTTGHAIADNFPFGTGLGSFEPVYRLYEDPASVTATYVNHAHNDYLELTLELGLPGALLILAFLGWWAVRCVQIWRSNLSSPFARAATIASAAILAHSFVDYPLRTGTIAAVFGLCIGIMSRLERQSAEAAPASSTGARHVTIG